MGGDRPQRRLSRSGVGEADVLEGDAFSQACGRLIPAVVAVRGTLEVLEPQVGLDDPAGSERLSGAADDELHLDAQLGGERDGHDRLADSPLSDRDPVHHERDARDVADREGSPADHGEDRAGQLGPQPQPGHLPPVLELTADEFGSRTSQAYLFRGPRLSAELEQMTLHPQRSACRGLGGLAPSVTHPVQPERNHRKRQQCDQPRTDGRQKDETEQELRGVGDGLDRGPGRIDNRPALPPDQGHPVEIISAFQVIDRLNARGRAKNVRVNRDQAHLLHQVDAEIGADPHERVHGGVGKACADRPEHNGRAGGVQRAVDDELQSETGCGEGEHLDQEQSEYRGCAKGELPPAGPDEGGPQRDSPTHDRRPSRDQRRSSRSSGTGWPES